MFVLLFSERKQVCLFCLWLLVIVLVVSCVLFCLCVSMLFACCFVFWLVGMLFSFVVRLLALLHVFLFCEIVCVHFGVLFVVGCFFVSLFVVFAWIVLFCLLFFGVRACVVLLRLCVGALSLCLCFVVVCLLVCF